jgi:hypothetical protein
MQINHDGTLSIEEKYEKLRQQRLNATKKWNNAHRDKVNEYSKFYQRRLNAKKREMKALHKSHCIGIADGSDYSEAEHYKLYQECYRKTVRLRKLPFFNSDIIVF